MSASSLTRFKHALIVGAFVLTGGCSADDGTGTAPNNEFCETALESAQLQMNGFRQAYPDPMQIPRTYENGQVRLVSASDWTSGFVGGSFWYMYEATQDESWRVSAESRTAVLESQQYTDTHHDLGFMMFSTYGNGLRLADNAAYQAVLIQSADSLLSRYSETVGATRSWDHGTWSFPVIVDNMMNLELLYWASIATNDPKYADAATSHALTTLNDHFRGDYSSVHVVDYDPATGAVIGKQTHQGIADDSSWSRGQAWGLYGFTMAYRFTRDPRFLELAQNIAGFYLDHPNLPEDRVPYFDFDVPGYPEIENTRDTSAAAITASALLELAEYVSEPAATRYHQQALAMLHSLASPAYSGALGENGHFLLKHATGNYPANSEIDAAINYADYYYLEALLRCRDRL